MTDAGPRRRTLIVEDEPAIRELVRFHLDLAGFDVTEIGDGRRALADDHLAKPFDTRELVARVAALLRRQDRTRGDTGVKARLVERNGLRLDPDSRSAAIRGAPIELTRQEFDLLHLLVTHPGIVFGREALIARVWGGDT